MATISLDSRKLDGEFYHRRLDRSPEKDTFYSLPQEDRALVSQLRQAVAGAKSKVTKLNDQLNEREKSAEQEMTLRKAAEEKLDKLVDMYGDPAVNAELHERLPRAAHTNNMEAWMHQAQTPPTARKTDSSGDDTKQMTSSERHELGSQPSTTLSAGLTTSSTSQQQTYPGPPYLPSIYPISTPLIALLPPQTTLPNNTQLLSHAVPVSNPDVSARSTANTPVPAHDSAMAVEEDETDMDRERQVRLVREHQTQITSLLTELDAVRQLNNKLQRELDEKTRELATLRLSHDLNEERSRAQHADQLAALIEEIYRAQRERDEAMMARLHSANQERDDALSRLQEQRNSSMSSLASSLSLPSSHSHGEDIGRLLLDLDDAQSVDEINKQGRHLVDALNVAKRRRWDACTEEVKVILEERDNAILKCGRLERALDEAESEKKEEHGIKQHITLLRGRLAAVQHERDVAIDKLRDYEKEVQSLRVFYSLHKSLSQEEELRDQYTSSLETLEAQVKSRDSTVDRLQSDNARLIAQVDSLTAQNDALVSQLKTAQAAQEDALASKEKMERLVNVLRRKINGLGSKGEV